MECQLSDNQGVNELLIEWRSRASIEGIDQHSPADTFSIHDNNGDNNNIVI